MTSYPENDDFFSSSSNRNPEYEEKQCDRCNEFSRHVYNRASLAQKRFLCRRCVSIVEEERHKQNTRDVFRTIREQITEQ